MSTSTSSDQAGTETERGPDPADRAGPTPPPRWFELAAVRAVLTREWALYRRTWAPNTFAAVVEPVIFLLAFGFGLGSLVGAIGGYSYIEFIGTGIVAMSVLFISSFPALIETYVRRVYRHTYDGMLATPVDIRELVTGEATWLATKAGVYGCSPLLVAMLFGLSPTPTMVFVPFIGFVTGFGFALMGIWMSAVIPTDKMMDYVISGVITPVFLIAGTFFPLDDFPSWVQVLAQVNPLYHTVELVRHAAFGIQPITDLLHLGALLVFVVLMWGLAVFQMRRRLVD
ncbi:ABC transporter permease [Lipingzhangella sp. LS1_29]|uniref:Transport permease protein n=1 Tax=Lipingzhangella rawalii TaxID=2055835 RepID=A0ABU2HBE3_9ACTN|nr:ABC transporter permease [Lipingzhangella rawalii]MDS1272135.1 ABC transporter permease [Lipingzhangella rawalii]